VGVEEDGVTPLAETGNQVSYTLKYDPKGSASSASCDTLIEGQFSIRCCSVMPQSDTTAYEYQPEQPVTKEQYEHMSQPRSKPTPSRKTLASSMWIACFHERSAQGDEEL
jgi:hypothetical protein